MKSMDPDDELLRGLNDAQREAVLHGEGPLLVLAGAGSGKTRVIVHRIARLVRDERVAPWQILAVTFTNKAAGEMRERLEALLGPGARELWVSTFHAFGARFLRREAQAAGLDPSFPIYDTDDQLRLVKQVMAELRMDDGEPLAAREALSRIDRWKNHGVPPERARAGEQDRDGEAARLVYVRYERALRRAGAVDFGDLLLLPEQLLDRDERLRERWAGRFRHLLVDEFQDTNPAQYRLVRLLAGARRNVCVVGDDDQAIYRWRGADVSNILGFDEDFPGTRVVKLEQNYRSTAFILEAAHAVISRAARRREKKLFTSRDGGQPLAMMVGQDEHDEAERIASGIVACHRAGAPWEEIAVLYRTNAQSRPLEAALRGARVPYVVVRGTSFYERAEVKDAAAYLRLAVTPRSDLDLLRVVNRPARGIGEKSVDRLVAWAAERGLALYDALDGVEEMADLAPKARRALAAFRDLVRDLHARVRDLDAGIAVQEALQQSGMLARLQSEGTDEAAERAENLMELVAAAREFDEAGAGRAPPEQGDPETPPLARFLEQIALLGDADAETPEGRVALMTLHAAKGLEFEAVFLAGMEDGVLPHDPPWARRESSGEREARMDEERRLCYVGMTRAKSVLTLTLARRRMRYGELGPSWRESEPSRFLRDVPPEVFGGEVARRFRERQQPAPASPHAPFRPPPRAPVVRRYPGASESDPRIELDEDPRAPQQSRREARRDELDFDQSPEGTRAFAPGARVTHPTLGEGIVRASEGPGPEAKVTVAFFAAGEKRVIAKFLRPA